jgi:hypothetical protein
LQLFVALVMPVDIEAPSNGGISFSRQPDPYFLLVVYIDTFHQSNTATLLLTIGDLAAAQTSLAEKIFQLSSLIPTSYK